VEKKAQSRIAPGRAAHETFNYTDFIKREEEQLREKKGRVHSVH